MSASTRSAAYIWLDTEFTCLDLEEAELLQVAVVITTPALERMTPPEGDLVLYLRLAPGARVSPWVEEHLADLLLKCRGADALPLRAVEQRLCRHLDRVAGTPAKEMDDRPVVAGNSVHADCALLRRLMPGFIDRCHYRIADVSAIKLQWHDHAGGEPFDKEDPERVRQWWPPARLPPAAGAHDAYYDVQASIAELAYYRQVFLKATPCEHQASA